ncbi:MCE family protein [Dactylosporangium sp. CA-092794]|uniref:MCE family protein n=1 Tax=Dactylosporangium sp. CA-092794 TaxID=3239929 RepID=UPI003D9400DF
MRVRRIVTFAVAAVVVAGVALVVTGSGHPQRRLVAHFTSAVGITSGSSVRVLGVRIGEVISVRPEGRTVRVEMRYDAGWPIPAGAQALIIPPSVVSDRYVQLTPAYNGGDVLTDNADLPVERTAVPLEIDDIYRALDQFNKALGPDGANADGALKDLVAAGRANLEGNGDELHAALDGLDKALTTVADGRQDLFGTLVNLQQFTTALARSDAAVRSFNQRLADVAGQLAADRDDLAAALRALATALSQVTAFVRDNRDALKSNVDALADVTGILVRQQRAIAEILDVTPLAVSNLNLAYNPRSGTLDTRDNALGPYDAAAYVCAVLADAVPVAQLPKECTALTQTLNGKLPPVTAAAPSTSAGPATGGQPAAPALPSLPEVTRDLTLGGILRGTP